jgi:hypothetical protein
VRPSQRRSKAEPEVRKDVRATQAVSVRAALRDRQGIGPQQPAELGPCPCHTTVVCIDRHGVRGEHVGDALGGAIGELDPTRVT